MVIKDVNRLLQFAVIFLLFACNPKQNKKHSGLPAETSAEMPELPENPEFIDEKQGEELASELNKKNGQDESFGLNNGIVRQIYSTYRYYLCRRPDRGGFIFWYNQMASGKVAQWRFVTAVRSSPEARSSRCYEGRRY